jgi:hypothetical protein
VQWFQIVLCLQVFCYNFEICAIPDFGRFYGSRGAVKFSWMPRSPKTSLVAHAPLTGSIVRLSDILMTAKLVASPLIPKRPSSSAKRSSFMRPATTLADWQGVGHTVPVAGGWYIRASPGWTHSKCGRRDFECEIMTMRRVTSSPATRHDREI